MILIDNKCDVSSNCSPGWVKVDYYCKKCLINCKQCRRDNIAICEECDDGYYLNRYFRCVGGCTLKSQYSIMIKPLRCGDCSDNCQECRDSYNCIVCNYGYYLSNNVCRKCELGMYEIDGRCEICPTRHCIDCKYRVCMKCNANKRLYNEKCIDPPCPLRTYDDGNNNCRECPIYCSECDSSGCKTCDIGYSLDDIKNCTNKCPAYFIPNPSGGCDPCKLRTKFCYKCKRENLEECEQCIYGRFLYKSKCWERCPNGTFELMSGYYKYTCSGIRKF